MYKIISSNISMFIEEKLRYDSKDSLKGIIIRWVGKLLLALFIQFNIFISGNELILL